MKFMQKTLDKQMEEHHAYLNKERNDRISAAAICVVSPTEDLIDPLATKETKKKFALDLKVILQFIIHYFPTLWIFFYTSKRVL